MKNFLTLETKKYLVKTSNFEGPLDLLCHLVDKNKMEIYDINISQITDQYIEYIKEMEKMNLEITSEFLVIFKIKEVITKTRSRRRRSNRRRINQKNNRIQKIQRNNKKI